MNRGVDHYRRIGAISAKRRRAKEIENYNINPNHCLECNQVIPVKEGRRVSETRSRDYCGTKCTSIARAKLRKSRNRIEVGTTFHRLTVTGDSIKSKAGVFEYPCMCSCGNLNMVRGDFLKNGAIKSCGCLQKEVVSSYNGPKSEPGSQAKKKLIRSYRRGAKHRGLEFHLTDEDCESLFKMDCHYCGSPPSATSKVVRTNDCDEFIYNGIDRIENTLGYLKNNIVPCCSLCNFMKGSKTVTEFLSHVEKIKEHQITLKLQR